MLREAPGHTLGYLLGYYYSLSSDLGAQKTFTYRLAGIIYKIERIIMFEQSFNF
jgi:hypothetical protein